MVLLEAFQQSNACSAFRVGRVVRAEIESDPKKDEIIPVSVTSETTGISQLHVVLSLIGVELKVLVVWTAAFFSVVHVFVRCSPFLFFRVTYIMQEYCYTGSPEDS